MTTIQLNIPDETARLIGSFSGSVSNFMLRFVTVPKTQYLSAFCER